MCFFFAPDRVKLTQVGQSNSDSNGDVAEWLVLMIYHQCHIHRAQRDQGQYRVQEIMHQDFNLHSAQSRKVNRGERCPSFSFCFFTLFYETSESRDPFRKAIIGKKKKVPLQDNLL